MLKKKKHLNRLKKTGNLFILFQGLFKSNFNNIFRLKEQNLEEEFTQINNDITKIDSEIRKLKDIQVELKSDEELLEDMKNIQELNENLKQLKNQEKKRFQC